MWSPGPIPPPQNADMNYGIFETFGSVMDLASFLLGLGVLGATAFIAWKQFRVMEEQEALINEQNEASKRMEKMTARQGEIMEAQHRIEEQLRSHRAKFSLSISGQRQLPGVGTSVQLFIENTGTKGADGVHWTLLIPIPAPSVRFLDNTGTSIGMRRVLVDNEQYHRIDNFVPDKIFPYIGTQIATIRIPQDMDYLPLLWRIVCDDGISPDVPSGYGRSELIRLPNKDIGLLHPLAYGDNSPVDNLQPDTRKPQ